MSDSDRNSQGKVEYVYRKKRRTSGFTQPGTTTQNRKPASKTSPAKRGQYQGSPKSRSDKKGLLDNLGSFFNLGPRTSSKSKKTGRSYEAPPILVRGAPVVRTTTRSTGRGKPPVRRRYDMNVPNAPAASISLPAFPIIGFSWRILSMILVASLSFAIYFLWTSPMFTINNVEIHGLQRIQPYDLNAVLGVSGVPSFLVDAERLNNSILEKFPAITESSVEFEFPNKVIVNVKERVPVLIWIQSGRTDMVDGDGIAFPMLLEGINLEESGLPMVDASGIYQERELVTKETVETSLLDQIFSLFREEEQEGDPVEPRQVIEPEMVQAVLVLKDYAPEGIPLLFTVDHGFAWEDPGGWMVYFGDANDIEMKLRVYHSILRHLDRNEETPNLVSVEWVDAPYYRLER